MSRPGSLRSGGILAIAVFAILSACGRDEPATDTAEPTTSAATETAGEPLRVVEVDLGRSVDADLRIADDTDDFSPTDTVYASVATRGTRAGAAIMARWTFEDGQVVDETSRTISPTGPSNTEFHISMPSGLPSGEYTVEILLDGQSVGRESFEVE
jgi:hypothetical protein